MGRRKSRKVQKAKPKPKVPSVFDCPFCNHAKSVSCTMRKESNSAKLRCSVCDESFEANINPLSQPVDIYCQWLDECEKENAQE